MVQAQDAASFLVHLKHFDEQREGTVHSLNNVKINALVFLVHYESIRRYHHSFIADDHFQRGRFGPINPWVYRRFERYGHDDIPIEESSGQGPGREAELIRSIWKQYGKMPPTAVGSIASQKMMMLEDEERRKKRREHERMMFPQLWWKQ